MRDPDATVSVTLLPTNQGGRDGPLIPMLFACVVQVADLNLDARLQIQAEFPLGATRKVKAWFLSPDLALSVITPGTPFKLWDGRTIGWGDVKAVQRTSAEQLSTEVVKAKIEKIQRRLRTLSSVQRKAA